MLLNPFLKLVAYEFLVQQSSGRGGAGNIRRTSTSRDPATTPKLDGPDDFSQTRGREMGVTPAVTHTGRGGAGNIRSPSRGRAPAVPLSPTQHEKEVIKQYAQREADLPHSSGRGGAGNIAGGVAYASSPNQSQSRSRSGVRSSGRGGAGNMISPTTTDIQGVAMLDELERIKHHHPEGLYVMTPILRRTYRLTFIYFFRHSTGRGGLANFTTAPSPGIDLPPIHESHGDSIVVSSGRGGAGNIRQTSRSRTRGD